MAERFQLEPLSPAVQILAAPNSLVAAAEPIAEKTAVPQAKTADVSIEIVEPPTVDP